MLIIEKPYDTKQYLNGKSEHIVVYMSTIIAYYVRTVGKLSLNSIPVVGQAVRTFNLDRETLSRSCAHSVFSAPLSLYVEDGTLPIATETRLKLVLSVSI